jgi:hypothetical protein
MKIKLKIEKILFSFICWYGLKQYQNSAKLTIIKIF